MLLQGPVHGHNKHVVPFTIKSSVHVMGKRTVHVVVRELQDLFLRAVHVVLQGYP